MFIQTYLKFRILQFLRIFQQVGIFRSIFLVLISGLLITIVYKLAENFCLPILFCFTIFARHNSRSDKKKLTSMLPNSNILYWIEYSFISLIFLLLSVIKGFYTDLFFYPIIIFTLPFLKSIRVRNIALSMPWFRKGSYEYQIMFRNSYPVLLICYIIAFLGLYNDNERVFYFGYFISSIFWFLPLLKPEPTIYMLNYLSSTNLIKIKTSNIIVNTLVLSVPFLLISPIGEWITMGMIVILVVSTICSTIGINMLKYCFSGNEFLATMIAVSVLVPLFIMSIIYPLFVLFNLLLNVFIIFRASDKLDLLFNYDNNTTSD